ncbi:hypothetical protein [Flavobacterium ginsengiterrae]|uniref:Uncharacterized protein n=1 Tax=Flavobacterium ginsengiterrae TaxID=871695 RepID=A0ABP7GMK9_9FLAO
MSKDKNELKKKLRSQIKKQILKDGLLLFPYDFEKTFKKDTLSINLKDTKIGEITIRQLTGKHERIGVVSSFVIEAKILSCSFLQEIEKMQLSFIDLEFLKTNGVFNFYSGELKKLAFFKDYGVISFYQYDNIEEKVLEMIEQINLTISVRMLNIFMGNLEAINDILSVPYSYSYPTIFSAVICKINNRADLLETVIKNCKSQKMSDSLKSNVEEILSSIQFD